MKGLKKVAQQTKKLGGYFSSKVLRVFYNVDKDLIWAKIVPRGSEFKYIEDIVMIDVLYPKTAQQIADMLITKQRFLQR